MPGKVNPVIPEAVTQAAMKVIGNDGAMTFACASGNLELNAFLPLVADVLLENIDLLARANLILRQHCVEGITADEKRCRDTVDLSTAIATALLPALGYERMCEVVRKAEKQQQTIRQVVLEEHLLSASEFDELTSPEAVCRIGHPASSSERAKRPAKGS